MQLHFKSLKLKLIAWIAEKCSEWIIKRFDKSLKIRNTFSIISDWKIERIEERIEKVQLAIDFTKIAVWGSYLSC